MSVQLQSQFSQHRIVFRAESLHFVVSKKNDKLIFFGGGRKRDADEGMMFITAIMYMITGPNLSMGQSQL